MDTDKREALSRGRGFLNEALKAIDAAIAAQEILEHAKALATEAKELPAEIQKLKAEKGALESDIEKQAKRLASITRELEQANRDWLALKKSVNG